MMVPSCSTADRRLQISKSRAKTDLRLRSEESSGNPMQSSGDNGPGTAISMQGDIFVES